MGIPLMTSWVELASLLAVIVGGAWAIWQWRESLCVKRMETLTKWLEMYSRARIFPTFTKCIDNADGKQAFYIGSLTFVNEDIEVQIDTMLTFFTQVCSLLENGFIGDNEMDIFEYQLRRIRNNKQICRYLADLKESFPTVFPYGALMRYAQCN